MVTTLGFLCGASADREAGLSWRLLITQLVGAGEVNQLIKPEDFPDG